MSRFWRRWWGRVVYVLRDVVWGVTIVAFCYAVVVAVIDRGKRKAMAVGFVAMATAYFVCGLLAPSSGPVVRLYRAAGYVLNNGEVYAREAADSALVI